MKKISLLMFLLVVFFVVSPGWAFQPGDFGGSSTDVDVGVSTTSTNIQEQGNLNVNNPSFRNSLELTFEASEPKRGIHISPEVQYPGLVGQITDDGTAGPLFTDMLNLLKYKSAKCKIGEPAVFTRREIEPIVKKARAFLGIFGDEPKLLPRYFGGFEKLPKTDKIFVTFYPLMRQEGGRFFYPGYQKDFIQIGYLHCLATANDQVSLDILAVLLWDAIDHGATKADVMSQGIAKILAAFGWGLGTNVSGGSLNDLKGSATSAVMGGGTGVSKSQSWWDKLPWLQGAVGISVKQLPMLN